jgi:hypothetical protein
MRGMVTTSESESLGNRFAIGILLPMSTPQDIESAVRKLPRAAIEKLSEWIQDLLEDQEEFTKELKASIERGKRDIDEGRTRSRMP